MKVKKRSRLQNKNSINIIPFLDILLVLVAVLALSAEMVKTRSLVIDLPQTAKGEKNSYSPLSISITPEGVFFNGVKIELNQVFNTLSKHKNKTRGINIEGDRNVPYSDIAFVLEQIKNAGFSKISLITKLKV